MIKIQNVGRLALAALAMSTLVAPMAASSALSEPVVITGIRTDANGWSTPKPSFLHIQFHNEAESAANLVVFRVVDPSGIQSTIRDAGTFSKGVTIDHTYMMIGLRAKTLAEVVEVRFADGSTWQRHYPAPPERQQAM
jgi:hypothetical protein